MIFESFQVTGKGRGEKIGVPTINLSIPHNFELKDGIYAARITTKGQTYNGALHFGPVPVFNDMAKSLEVYLLDVDALLVPDFRGKKITVEIVKKIRDIKNFPTSQAMVERIKVDVKEIKKVLKTPA